MLINFNPLFGRLLNLKERFHFRSALNLFEWFHWKKYFAWNLVNISCSVDLCRLHWIRFGWLLSLGETSVAFFTSIFGKLVEFWRLCITCPYSWSLKVSENNFDRFSSLINPPLFWKSASGSNGIHWEMEQLKQRWRGGVSLIKTIPKTTIVLLWSVIVITRRKIGNRILLTQLWLWLNQRQKFRAQRRKFAQLLFETISWRYATKIPWKIANLAGSLSNRGK